MRRVVVTGMGVVSPVGQTVGEVFDNLANARSGIRPVAAGVYSGANASRRLSLESVMSNSFGFGGMNAVLVARHA